MHCTHWGPNRLIGRNGVVWGLGLGKQLEDSLGICDLLVDWKSFVL